MRSTSFRQTRSSSNIPRNTLRTIRALKQQRTITAVLGKLNSMRVTYQRPFHSAQKAPVRCFADNEEEEERDVNKMPRVVFEHDFAAKTRRLCEDVHFHMEAFAKLNRDNPRPKGIMVRLYGWDQCFVDLWFPNRKEENIKAILPTSNQIHQKLGLHMRTFKTRNVFNKLKLFLSQLRAHNKKHQEAEGTILQNRLQGQIKTLDQKMKTLFIQRGTDQQVRRFMQEAGRAQQLMLHSKVRVKNKSDRIRILEEQLGGVNINEFFIREENALDKIEKHVTAQRLSRNKQ